MQTRISNQVRSPLRLVRLLAALICLQFCILMTAEAAHFHDLSAPHPATCQLCATPHVPLAAAPAQLRKHVLGRMLELDPGMVSRGARFVVFAVFIRPPPSL